MFYILLYFLAISLFWTLWLSYIPRRSFVYYLKNENIDNLKLGWQLFKIETQYNQYNYFVLWHKNLDVILIFDYESSSNKIYIKDDRFRTYQENKILTKLILKYFSVEDLNKAIYLTKNELELMKNKRSYYDLIHYDYQLNPLLDLK